MALSATSPAIDAADSATALQTDQHLVLRPAGAEDIGAYESVPVTTSRPSIRQRRTARTAGTAERSI